MNYRKYFLGTSGASEIIIAHYTQQQARIEE
jgi:hypothetical protein